MELIQGCLNKDELKLVKKFIRDNFSAVIHPDEKTSEKAIALLERHTLSDGLRTVDAIIAASALTNSTALATANFKHFKSISILEIMKFTP
jgi:predicted nucleic acid-binding protein